MTKRALISVYYKDKIVEFAKGLRELGWELISTGGSYKILKEAGIDVFEVSEITEFNEILDGRVKTLHPKIHGGILYRRDDDSHVKTMQDLNMGSIDMVVNNLYPFEQVLNKENATHEELIENIDIGGPSMIRAAAKNYKDVITVVDYNDYDEVLNNLKNGGVNNSYRLKLAGKAFNYTAYYDSLISGYFNDINGERFPEKLTFAYGKESDLRYGENPHQKAAYYKKAGVKSQEIADFKQLHGKELSYNNYSDINAAVKIVKEFHEPCVVGVKHGNPSGIGIGESINTAFDKAYNCDPVSIFGGIFAINREVDEYIAEKINEFFVEIVIAPGFSKEAFEILTLKKNIRLIEMKNIAEYEEKVMSIKETLNGLLYQEADNKLFIDDVKVVTKKLPTEEEMKELVFAWKACKNISSNGVVITKNFGTIGIGVGEVRRSWAVEEAIQRCEGNVQGAVMASDAFFFKDTVEMLAKAGIKAVIQPGGSIKDPEVIQACDDNGIAMVFTGIRHFRH